ncbi:MAG TPA: hypothetical protein DCX21_01895 [Eubacterium sp.]|nr:hypothetical protein [Eubacterium sp.]
MKCLLIGLKSDIALVQTTMRADVDCNWLLVDEYCELDRNLDEGCLYYDAIIVAVADKTVSARMVKSVIETLSISPNKVFDFYRYYDSLMPYMRADRCMKAVSSEGLDGIILGISMAAVGIIPEMLGNYVNLAVSSQDLYYNYKTLDYCYNKYNTKLRTAKRVIIDMYDYTYFNFDVSLGIMALPYYSRYHGFILDSHNFEDNHLYSYDFSRLTSYVINSQSESFVAAKKVLWDKIFDMKNSYNVYADISFPIRWGERFHIASDEEIANYNVKTSIVTRTYQKTIDENVATFEKLLKLIYRINPDMDIVLVFMPFYYQTQMKYEALYQNHKEFFLNTITEFKKRYPIRFINYKNCFLAHEKRCYFDAIHFNYWGASNFTKLLKNDLHNL